MNDVSIIKAIKKCEYDFEVRAEKFLWHHPILGFFSIFVGMPLIVLCAVCREAGTTSVPIPQGEDSENTPLPDLPEQPENVDRKSVV